VRRSPCGVEKTPARARLLWAVTVKENMMGNYK
jgi:hypothetical protein